MSGTCFPPRQTSSTAGSKVQQHSLLYCKRTLSRSVEDNLNKKWRVNANRLSVNSSLKANCQTKNSTIKYLPLPTKPGTYESSL